MYSGAINGYPNPPDTYPDSLVYGRLIINYRKIQWN